MVTRVQDAMNAAAVVHAVELSTSRTADTDTARYSEDSAQQSVQDMTQSAELQQPANAADAKNDPNAQQRQDKKQEEKLDENQVSLLTQELNKIMSRITANLSFEYHKEVNLLSVRMLDRKTGETLKEMPPEKMIENLKRTREWIGTFIDEHA
ncbi:hypothetical protein TAMA11512_22320 [Selenomonas sp. TAMA-11512]|uniref:flagellar protein FlaG n=1 Tax=Selenomonas sp. TAMA-11512 TaxID=3095337 RepID=UPI0030851248|nr:hypothetical protein TAMA11512_22320 [Selenomonas sp. TAMA-11512]